MTPCSGIRVCRRCATTLRMYPSNQSGIRGIHLPQPSPLTLTLAPDGHCLRKGLQARSAGPSGLDGGLDQTCLIVQGSGPVLLLCRKKPLCSPSPPNSNFNPNPNPNNNPNPNPSVPLTHINPNPNPNNNPNPKQTQNPKLLLILNHQVRVKGGQGHTLQV